MFYDQFTTNVFTCDRVRLTSNVHTADGEGKEKGTHAVHKSRPCIGSLCNRNDKQIIY